MYGSFQQIDEQISNVKFKNNLIIWIYTCEMDVGGIMLRKGKNIEFYEKTKIKNIVPSV